MPFIDPTEPDAHQKIGLRHNPFLALVAPRPIGWISSLDAAGVPNLAPFSFFNAVSSRPPVLVFSCSNDGPEGEKDTLRNVRETGEFVFNLATWDLRLKMNASSAPAPRGVDEFELAGLAKAPSRKVRPPRVADSPVALECTLLQVVELPVDGRSGRHSSAAFGRVVGIHIDERLIAAGRVDITRARPVARLGYMDYAVVDAAFEIKRPTWPPEGE